jgi:hypothetical protein
MGEVHRGDFRTHLFTETVVGGQGKLLLFTVADGLYPAAFDIKYLGERVQRSMSEFVGLVG